MKMKSIPRHYHSIPQLFRTLQLQAPVHRFIGIIDYSTMKVTEPDVVQQFTFDFYTITFKKNFKGTVGYGQGHYNFEAGGLLFTAPKQIIYSSECNRDRDGYTLFFHADLYNRHVLRNTLTKYGYFSYAVDQALLLDGAEKKDTAMIFYLLHAEMRKTADHFSQDIIVSYVELLLNCSNRLYNRQYLYIEKKHHDILCKMEIFLEQYYNKDTFLSEGLPTVQQVATYLEVSTRFLNDTLRAVTGYNTKYHIHDLIIEKSKVYLSTQNYTIAEIAYKLGFKHPQSFNKLFKLKTGQSPVEYRKSFNQGSKHLLIETEQ